jgi:amino acid adenylation domain-containing protein
VIFSGRQPLIFGDRLAKLSIVIKLLRKDWRQPLAMNNSGNVINEQSGMDAPFPRERSVVDFLREYSQMQPDALAVRDGGGSMTYGELDRQSNLVAHDFQQRGLHLEDPVAILLPASGDYVVAMLGILKAGGSYLPIDPDAPVNRLEFLLQDSGSRFALTDAKGIKRLGDWPGTVLELAQIIAKPGTEPRQVSGMPSDPGRRAYIVYTSGSTGQPKGVEIEHHSLTNLVCAYHERFKLAAQDRATMLANVAFDASVQDVWPVLCVGGTLVVPPKALLQHPDSLIAWLADEKITWTFVPTGMAEILFAREWPAQMSLRFLVTGGDRLRIRPPQSLPFTVLNAYGPTENTVISTWSVLTARNGDAQLPAIGHPIANVKAYVLDEQRQPVAGGVAGELYLGGEQLARGYFGKPALSAERFVPDPFSGRPNGRMYRTGDWVRWLPDGELDFLGRRDDQVQIRGSRVELGEIEAALLAHPAVRQACCLPRSENGQATGIVAHIVVVKDGGDSSGELRSHLGGRLPAYMLPSLFVFHEHLPLTPYGKVDRTALADSSSKSPARPKIDADGDGLEIALARLWHSLLPAAGSSPKDATFANLGGDSLLVVKLMLGVEEITNQRLEVSTFLIQPTFSGLCQAVKTRMAQTEFQPVLVLRKQGNRPPLFCLYNYEGDIDLYFNLAEALGDDQPVFGIRSPALEDLSRLPVSMEAAAAEIVGCIRKIQPQGIPALVGYSWAGLLAFEVARQLAKQGGISCFTALVGADAPMWPTNFASRLAHFARTFPPWLWHLVTDRENRWQRLSRWRRMAGRTKQNLSEAHLPMKNWVSTPISRHLVALMEKYRPLTKSDLEVDLFRERGSYHPRPHPLHAWQTSDLPDGGWDRWTRKPARIHWLEGDHTMIIRPPAVSGLAQAIRQAMDQHMKCHLPVLEVHANPR